MPLFLLNILMWMGLVYVALRLLRRILLLKGPDWRSLCEEVAYWLWGDTYEPENRQGQNGQ